MKYVRIVNGIVAEIIVPREGFALSDLYHPDFLAALVEAPDDVVPGWRYEAGVLLAPVTQTVTEADLLAYAADRRWRRETSGVAIMIAGEPVVVSTARGDDRAALHMTYTAIKDGLRADGATFNFADGKPRHVSNEAMTEAILLALTHVQSAFDRGEEIYGAIKAGDITSIAEIDAAFAD